MVGSIDAATKRVIVIPIPTTEVLSQIAQDTTFVKKPKNSTSLVDTVSCPIKAIPSKNSNKPVDLPEDIGVTALVAIMEPATEKMSSKGPQITLRSRPSNKIRAPLDLPSNGTQTFSLSD